MKATFFPARSAPVTTETPPVEQSPERITVRELLPESNEPEFTPPGNGEPAPPIGTYFGETDSQCEVYRSVVRPGMAVLTALDDGSLDQGQEWRIRTDRFVIGRTGGDCIIPHDVDLSGTHAEIVRDARQGAVTWMLRDLKSTNGMFIQMRRTVLKHGREILLGRGRYEFQCPSIVSSDAMAHGPTSTRRENGLGSEAVQHLQPRLIELTAIGDSAVYPLRRPPLWIGSDPRCGISIPHDPFLSPKHARLTRDTAGRWILTAHDSLNGVLIRIRCVTVEDELRFQLGGQRFVLRIS